MFSPGTKTYRWKNDSSPCKTKTTKTTLHAGYARFQTNLTSVYKQMGVQKTTEEIDFVVKKYANSDKAGSSVSERLQNLCIRLKKKYEKNIGTAPELENALDKLLKTAKSDDLQNCKVCSRVVQCDEHDGGISKACGQECDLELCGILVHCKDIKKCIRGCGKDIIICKEDFEACYKCGAARCKDCSVFLNNCEGCDKHWCNECGSPKLCDIKCARCEVEACQGGEFETCIICESPVCTHCCRRLCWTGRPNWDTPAPWPNERFTCETCSRAHLYRCDLCEGERSTLPAIQNLFCRMRPIDCCDDESGPWYWVICRCDSYHLPSKGTHTGGGGDPVCRPKCRQDKDEKDRRAGALKIFGYERGESPSDRDLRRRYKVLARQHHPDKYQNADERKCAEERMKAINAARVTLGIE